MKDGARPAQPTWPLLTTVTLAAVILYVSRVRGDRPWVQELGVFLASWICIALFAMLGRALSRRRRG